MPGTSKIRKMINSPKILVGTLYSGENEFDDCRESLELQDYRRWDQFVIKNLPNVQAHRDLYATFMSNARDYNLFLKLDADMVLSSPGSLSTVVDIFKQNHDVDHVEMVVHDWFSDSLIMGIHAATSKAVWRDPNNPVFVDPYPIVPGKHLCIKGDPAPIVIHSPNPSPFQGYHYGVHKAIKIVQRGLTNAKIDHSIAHTDILLKVWKHFCKTKDRRLGLCILGAEDYFAGGILPEEYNCDNPVLTKIFSKYETLRASELFEMLDGYWGGTFSRRKNSYRKLKIKRMSMKFLPFFKEDSE